MALNLCKVDKPYSQIFSFCSPNLQRFIKGLTNQNSVLNFELLKKAGCNVLEEGALFRVAESIRTYDEQASTYLKGRATIGSFKKILSIEPAPFSGYRYEWTGKKVDNVGVTNAFPGASYHNWGLAVDIYFRKFGWEAWQNGNKVCGYTMSEFYKASGLVDWAKKCGLNWGGDWISWQDICHFEDDCVLPSSSFWFSDNNSYQSYLSCRAYSSGSSHNSGVASGKSDSGKADSVKDSHHSGNFDSGATSGKSDSGSAFALRFGGFGALLGVALGAFVLYLLHRARIL